MAAAHAAKSRSAAAPSAPPPGVSLGEQAYESIKHKIITLEYRPGQYLNEAAIRASLSLGRTPVHQALHRLKLEGLVEIIPRKGVIVRPDTLNEVLEIMEARWVAEPYCAGLAAERATPDQVAAMEGALARGRNMLSRRSMTDFMHLDQEFHRGMAAAARNRILGDLLRSLHERASRVWFLRVWDEADLRRTQTEHEAVMAAVKRGDRNAAVKAMQRHITSLRRRIVSVEPASRAG